MASNGRQKTTLESLPADVARIIVEEIHDGEDSSLFPFSTVSKACRSQCEPLLFRSIKLHSKGRAAYQTTQHIIKRLQDPSDSLRIHVRHLTIGRFKESHLPRPETLVDIIQALGNLQSLSWNTYFAIPSEVLEALRIHRPSAQLNAKSHLRRRFPSDNPLRLDEALLASPQLHSLDIGIMCLEYGHDGNDKGSSELLILKERLIQGGSLKNLCLRFESIKCRSLETIYQLDTSKPAVYKPMHIPFQPGDTFPPLQELTLILADKSSSPAYNFTPSHCRLWRSCMDWSHLRSLKLVAKEPRYVVMSTPKNLLIELTGLVPQLQTFHLCGFSSMGANLERFLKAVTRLEDVCLDNALYVEFSADLNIVLDAQGRNLKRVELVCGSVSMETWKKEKYLDVLKRCGRIEFLSTKLGMNGKYVGHGEWDEDRCGGTPEEKFADMYIKGLPSEYVPRSGFDGAMGFTIGRYGQLVPWGEEE